MPLICPVCHKDITMKNTVQNYYDDVMSDPEMGVEERKYAQDEYDSVEDKNSIVSSASDIGLWCDECERFYMPETNTMISRGA